MVGEVDWEEEEEGEGDRCVEVTKEFIDLI